MANFKVGSTYFYKGWTPCKVTGNTLNPGAVNSAEAIVQVDVNGTPITMLYETAGEYLKEKRISFREKYIPGLG